MGLVNKFMDIYALVPKAQLFCSIIDVDKPSQAETIAEFVNPRVTSRSLLFFSTFRSQYALIFSTVSSQVISETHS